MARGRRGSRAWRRSAAATLTGPAEHPDDQVAQAGHGVGSGAGADLGGILGEAGVADVVQRLDRPVPAQQVGEPGWTGLLGRQAGNGVDSHGPKPPGAGVKVAGPAGYPQDLGGVGEPELADRDRLEGPDLDAAVAAVAGAVQLGDAVPGQALAAVQQVGWLALTTNR